MSTKSKFLRQMLSMTLAVVMMLGIVPAAYAHDPGAEEGGDHEHDSTPYSVKVYNGKEPNRNGKLEFTVTCHEGGGVSEKYGVDNTEITAVEGDIITLYPEADEGYALSSIGYVKAERLGQSFNIKDVTDNKDGTYSFTMPANDVYVGAAFYHKDDYYITGATGTKNAVANVETALLIELGLNHAWLHQDAEEVSFDMHIDKRILTFGETAGKALTFRTEIREVGDAGFLLAGSKEYTADELNALIEEKDAELKTDDKGREYYVVRDVVTPVDAEYDFTLDKEVYCTAMFTLDGWTDAVGAKYYRWGYSGGDRAYILENNQPIPTSMVYFYNLDPDTYQGALAAEAIEAVEEEMDINIEVCYFTPENMTECIGYLAEWPGYESFGELGVDRQPSEKTFKKKIVLYCSLPSMVRDAVGDAVRETGVTNYMTTKLTAFGAAKSFEELYKTQESESEVFTAALALSLLAYETYTALPEAEYGEHELWTEYKTAYDEAIVLINQASEEAEPYRAAREKLLNVYLRILDKTLLEADFKFVIEEHDEENYKITVDPSDFPEGFVPEYYWYDASKLDHLIIAKNELYKVRCTVSSPDDSKYYGFEEIRLSTPAELEYDITADSSSVTVSFTKYETLTNTPEPITYTAELYKGGELQDALSNTTAEDIVFSGLEADTEYAVRIYASNIVGRTTYMNENVVTSAVIVDDWYDDEEDTTPVVKPAETPAFEDVDENAFYAEAVRWDVENNITTGVSETEFAPEMECTRAQIVTFLWRAAGAPKASGKNAFADVKADSYYYDAVMWAVANGITTGVSETEFAPEMECTRAQVVTFLNRASGEKAEASDAFDDIAEDSYYAEAANWAAQNGITTGTGERTFSPDAVCSRAQIVTFLYRMYK